MRQTYAKLTPWQKTLVARHPDRPHLKDYIEGLVEDFTPLAGDRLFAEDNAIIGGIGRFRGRSAMIIGQEKGSTRKPASGTISAWPNRKVIARRMRLMDLADSLQAPGHHPGRYARGLSRRRRRGARPGRGHCPLHRDLPGDSGAAGLRPSLAKAAPVAPSPSHAGNTVLMLEHAVYSVISPEGCASILWRSGEHAQDAAEALKLTANDLLKLKVVDSIVAEPLGGAHRDRAAAIDAVGDALEGALEQLRGSNTGDLRAQRREKFLARGTAEGG